MVNCKTVSTKNIIWHQYAFLEQPIFGAFSTAHINTCVLHWAKPRHFSHSVSQTRPQVHHHLDQPSTFPDLGQEDQQIDFAFLGSALWCPDHISALWPFPARNDEQMLHSLQAPLAWWEASKTHTVLCNLAITMKQLSGSTDVKQQACNLHSSLVIM